MSATAKASQPIVLPPLDLNLRYTISEACLYLKTSPSSIYKLIAAKQLDVVKMFSRTYVTGPEIRRQSLERTDPPPVPDSARPGRGRPRKLSTIPTPTQVVRKHK
jgi:excisionase family DNA binding protein